MHRNDIPIISAIKSRVNIDHNGTVLYIMISGSHLYGFYSPNSDTDYRGCFITDIHNLIGLHRRRHVIEMRDPADIVLFELDKEVRLALAGNCNVLEHLFATPIYSTPEYLTLRQLLHHCWGKAGVYRSYRGMAMFNYKKFIHRSGLRDDSRSPMNIRPTASAKKYLYVIRGLMAGIYALTMERVQPNLKILNNTWFQSPIVDALISAKERGCEKGQIPDTLDHQDIEQYIDTLFSELDNVYIQSARHLKPSVDQIDEVHKYVINLRKDLMS